MRAALALLLLASARADLCARGLTASAALLLASARADLCARGLVASLNDKNVCCPRACKYTGVEGQGGSCDEQQCQLGNGRCCPAQILKKRVPCAAPEDVGCVFSQNLEKLSTARAVRGLVGHFCRDGVRGTSGHRATCCPKHCQRCDACPGECCGALFAKSCATPSDVNCQGPRPELDLTDFKGERKDA